MQKITRFETLYKDILKINVVSNGNQHFTEEDYEKMSQFVVNNSNVDLELLLQICESFAHGHPDDKVQNAIEDYIKLQSEQILSNLDKLIPDQTSKFIDSKKQFYKKLLEYNISYSLIYDVYHIMDLPLMDLPLMDLPHLTKDEYYWGVKKILSIVAKTQFLIFDEWLSKTDRIDLKMIFLYGICDRWHSHYITEYFYQSRNPFLRAVALFTFFPFGRNFHARYDYQNNKIQNLVNIRISNIEKVYFAIYYLNRGYIGNDLKEIDKNDNLQNDIKFIATADFISEFTTSVLNDIFNKETISYEILRRLAEELNDSEQKHSILKFTLIKIHERLGSSSTDHDILLGNVVGNILTSLPDEYTDKISKNFDNVAWRLSLPYVRYKKYRNGFDKKTS